MKSRIFLAAALVCCSHAFAKEDIEFVAEHLPEVSMDNRYATLPVWIATTQQPDEGWTFAAQGSFSQASAGDLEVAGPMLSFAASRALSSRWTVTALGFADELALSGGDERDLQTLFAPSTPIARPVAASFDGLDGSVNHYGVGLSFSLASDRGWLGAHRWVSGLLFEDVDLRDYSWNFTILEGPDAGTRGQIDFIHDYRHFTPFAGLQLVRERGDWIFSPHALFALPLPRRGWVGHIQTDEFDIHGDTAEVGNGKHFGDPSLTLGFDITYRPAHLSVDMGTVLTQALLEPVVHKGIDRNWVLSVRWQH
jgi:hypothetical protein